MRRRIIGNYKLQATAANRDFSRIKWGFSRIGHNRDTGCFGEISIIFRYFTYLYGLYRACHHNQSEKSLINHFSRDIPIKRDKNPYKEIKNARILKISGVLNGFYTKFAKLSDGKFGDIRGYSLEYWLFAVQNVKEFVK